MPVISPSMIKKNYYANVYALLRYGIIFVVEDNER
jgi:hypothetical protein